MVLGSLAAVGGPSYFSALHRHCPSSPRPLSVVVEGLGRCASGPLAVQNINVLPGQRAERSCQGIYSHLRLLFPLRCTESFYKEEEVFSCKYLGNRNVLS